MKKYVFFLLLFINQAFAANHFFENHGLIFFYSSQCKYCHKFAPVLKKWAKENHAEILPLSFDNKTIKEFPKYLPVTKDWVEVVYKGKEISYPALFIVNGDKKIFPVLTGFYNSNELDERLTLLINKIKSYERGGL